MAVCLTLLPSPALAGTGKVAVIAESNAPNVASGATPSPWVVTYDFLRRNGVPFEVFNVGAGDWGDDVDADSVWFRKNFDAVIIPYLEAGVSLLGTWGSNFYGASATGTGINQSPLSGHWGIPVYVIYRPTSNGFMSGAFDETANAWVPGVRPGTNAAIPATSQRGTWGHKLKCKVRGDRVDTLYTQAFNKACLYATWPGNGTVAAIAYWDSTDASCTATDTVAVMWRFRPAVGKPGIVYSGMRLDRFGSCDGLMWALQNIYETTGIRSQPVPVAVEPHNSYAGSTDRAAALTHVRAIHDTLHTYGIVPTLALPQVNATNYGTPHDADTRAELRRMVSRGSRWMPGSNNAGFGLGFYNASDTAQVRVAFNSVMNSAANADSFALPPGKMSNRYVPPSGVAGAWTAKVLADAGITTVVSTIATAPANWTILTAATENQRPARHYVPGDASRRSLEVRGTLGWADGASLNDLAPGGAKSDYMGQNVTSLIGRAAQGYSTLYWHMSTNTTGADPYWIWFASVIGRHFAYFDKVIEPAQ